MAARRERIGELVRLAAWAMVLGPAAVLVHELAHYLVGWAYGFPVRLHPGSVSGGASLGVAPNHQVALQAAAGPAITVLLMAIAAARLFRTPFSPWAFALALTAPLRFLVGVTYLFWVMKSRFQGKHFLGQPNFDEYNAALALNLSPTVVVTLQAVGVLVFWIFVVRSAPAGRRSATVFVTLTGAIAGIALWMGWLGPALLTG